MHYRWMLVSEFSPSKSHIHDIINEYKSRITIRRAENKNSNIKKVDPETCQFPSNKTTSMFMKLFWSFIDTFYILDWSELSWTDRLNWLDDTLFFIVINVRWNLQNFTIINRFRCLFRLLPNFVGSLNTIPYTITNECNTSSSMPHPSST